MAIVDCPIVFVSASSAFRGLHARTDCNCVAKSGSVWLGQSARGLNDEIARASVCQASDRGCCLAVLITTVVVASPLVSLALNNAASNITGVESGPVRTGHYRLAI